MENPVITFGNARFSVITENLIRCEYSKDKLFIDYPTLFATNRSYNGCNFEVCENGNTLTIKTDAISLTYTDDGNHFSNTNLSCEIFGKVWHYGDKSEGNLGGTLPTLDYVAKDAKVDDGVLSKDGWFVINDSKAPPIIDGWIKTNNYKYLQTTDIYIFGYGRDYKKALRTLAYISGKVALPRKYVFGSWYSRWWPYSGDEIMKIVDGYDEHDFPLDIMVIDMDWHYHDWAEGDNPEIEKHQAKYGYGHATNIGWTGYTWNDCLVGDHKKLLDDLHKRGIYVTLNDHPADGIRSHEDCYADFMRDLGINPELGINLEFDISDKKYIDAFYKNAHSKLEDEGVDFWWVDWQQDEIKPFIKGTKTRHLPWINYCYYHHSEKDNKRGLSFSRWGGFGDQKHPIYFSGDTLADWDILKFEVEFTVKSSNVLAFYWGHDTGGFYGERNSEMYARWTQFTAFSAALRSHSQRDEKLDRCPWKWGELAEESMKKSYHLRSKLIPYIYSIAYRASEETLPIISGMYIDYPEIDEAYKHPGQYMFGPAFIVSPITAPADESGIAKKTVWLPDDGYYNFFTKEKYTKGEHEVSCDIMEFPLFIKGGVPVPMQGYTKRMVSTPLETLEVLCFPGIEGEFTLYEDDGISREFESGAYLKTKLSYKNKNGKITIDIAPVGAGYAGMPKTRGYKITLPLTDRKLNVSGVDTTVEFKDCENIITITDRDVFEKIHIELY